MKNMAEIHQLRPRAAVTAWMCSACGVDAACNCGAPLMSKAQRIREAIEADPDKPNKQIARETGGDPKQVRRERQKLEGDMSPSLPEEELCADCDTEEDFWQRSLGNMAGDAVALADQWTQQFGDWRRFEVTSDLVVLARQASDAWGNLAKIMETKL